MRGTKILVFLLAMAWFMVFPAIAKATEQTETQAETMAETMDGTETEEEGVRVGSYDSKGTFGISTELDGLSGDAAYLGSMYRENYRLDMEKTGITEILEAGLNAFANILFSAFRMLGMMVCAVVYFCLSFSFADSFSGLVGNIQADLVNGIYQQLWLLAVMFLAGFTVVKLAKRDMAGILGDFCMVIFVSALSFSVVKYSEKTLTVTTGLTHSISESVFGALDKVTGDGGDASYAKAAAGGLWVDLVHVPWMTLEFGDAKVDEDTVQEILSLEPGSADRKDIIADLDGETGCFDKGRGGDRLGMLLCYAVPFILKSVVFVAVALLQMLGQFLAVFIILLAAFVLVLAIVPSYGISLMQKWMNKFIDVHLSMVILSFILALMVWLNKVVFSYMGTFGWLITLLIQSVLCLALVMNYRALLSMLLHPRDGMQDVQRLLKMMARQNRGFYPGQGMGSWRFGDTGYGSGVGTRQDGRTETDEPYSGGQGYNWGGYGGGRDTGPEPYHGGQHYQPVYDPEGGQRGNQETAREEPGQAPDTENIHLQEPPYVQDYDAIRRAPTPQEVYDLYQDDKEDTGADTQRLDTVESDRDVPTGMTRLQKGGMPEGITGDTGYSEQWQEESLQEGQAGTEEGQKAYIRLITGKEGQRLDAVYQEGPMEEKAEGTPVQAPVPESLPLPGYSAAGGDEGIQIKPEVQDTEGRLPEEAAQRQEIEEEIKAQDTADKD